MARARLMKKEKSFIDELAEKGGRPLYEQTPAAARQVLADVQSGGKADAADTVAERTEIETVNGRKMTVEIVRPKEAKGALPVVFYIHGGGWVMGSDKTHERLIRTLAEESGAAVVFPVYENAPENGFPQMTEELFAVLKHVVENGGRQRRRQHGNGLGFKGQSCRICTEDKVYAAVLSGGGGRF